MNIQHGHKYENWNQQGENIPGLPHRWANEIKAWADGRLVQWCYVGDNEWYDCDYASRGGPNWMNPTLGFRVAS